MTNDKPPLIKCLILLAMFMLFYKPTIISTSPTEVETQRLVIRGGNSIVGLSSPNGYSEKSLGMMVVTAYSSTVDQCDSTPFITANGERVSEGGIACPRYIPFGTLVKIDDEIYTCNDRMNERYAHRFDIWFASTEQATQFGKQVKEIIRLD